MCGGVRPGSSHFLGTVEPLMFLGVDSGSQSPEAVSAPQEHFELHVTVPSRRVLNWKCIFF